MNKAMKENLLKRFEQALKDNNKALIEKISNLLEGASAPQYGTLSILGREHKTVIIGHQEWMAENLFCPELGFHYDNDPKNSENGYGTLHAHYAMPAIHEILPDEGWRVSSDEDWDVLVKHVGYDAGKKLKSKEGWCNGGNGTDLYGFRVLPAGCRSYNGSNFANRGNNAYFWSSSAYSSTNAWYRYFYYYRADVYRYANLRSSGFSVRCIRDIK
jgi:uncharacterized protein (TIGR02145 family)